MMELDDPLDLSDPLQETANLESSFYDQGHLAGFAHGELHGLFEGRQLGREKGFELWEEVGFYQGSGAFWLDVLGREHKSVDKSREGRALNHARHLLDLISSFPTSNPSSTSATPPISSAQPSSTTPAPARPYGRTRQLGSDPASQASPIAEDAPPKFEVELPLLLAQIRSRYRLLCSTLGVRPRLVASRDADRSEDAATEGVVQGFQGPMKGVNTAQLTF